MRKNGRIVITGLVLLSAALYFSGCAALPGGASEEVSAVVRPAPEGSGGFPVIEFPVPRRAADRKYLGIQGKESFTLADIDADLVIIELFSMYCPHCQREAPKVNELYDLIRKDPEVKDRVKMIGIGVRNSPFEMSLFKRRYSVRFPLFPDKKRVVGDAVEIPGTPTFIAVKIEGGVARKVLFQPGGFEEPGKFLDAAMNPPAEKKEVEDEAAK